MLGKLIKHEWKATWRVPTLLIGILMAFTVFLCLLTFLPIWDSDWVGTGFTAMLFFMLYYFALIACSLGVCIYLVVRYYRSMFTAEGYLTHTLPVTGNQLFISKIINYIIWSALSALSVFTSAFVIVLDILYISEVDMPDWSMFFEELGILLADPAARGWQLYLVIMVIYMIIATVCGSIIMLSCVNIGQLFTKHRVAGAIGTYFIITFAMQILTFVVMIPIFVGYGLTIGSSDLSEFSFFDIYNPMFGILSVMMLLIGIGLFIWSEYIIKKKLNLE